VKKRAMTKTEKKLEKAIIKALTDACETAKLEAGECRLRGFEWLTHFVNYADFPNSLLIVCVFGTNEQRLHALESGRDRYFWDLVRDKLGAENIHLKSAKTHLRLDSEESCDQQHAGDWQRRYRQIYH